MAQLNSSLNRITNLKLLEIPVPIGGAIGIVAVCLIFSYWFFPNKREDIKFTAAVIAASSAIYSAFYAGRGLHYNANSKKIDRTLECATRWHDSTIIEAKKSLRLVLKEIAAIDDKNQRLKRLKDLMETSSNGQELENNLIEILNFLEQLGVFVEENVVDEILLKKFYKTIVVRYYNILEPWILERRNKVGFQRLYISLEILYTKWNS